MRRELRIVLSALLAAAAALVLPVWGLASANGNSLEIFRASEGRYEIIVGVQPDAPVVGLAHFTIMPLDLGTSAPVIDAEVNIVAHDPQDRPTYRVRAVNSPAARNYYDANITFDSTGEWTLFVEVESAALGHATVAVPLRVGAQALGPSLAGTITWLIVLGVLVGGSLYLWNKQRRYNRRL